MLLLFFISASQIRQHAQNMLAIVSSQCFSVTNHKKITKRKVISHLTEHAYFNKFLTKVLLLKNESKSCFFFNIPDTPCRKQDTHNAVNHYLSFNNVMTHTDCHWECLKSKDCLHYEWVAPNHPNPSFHNTCWLKVNFLGRG